jgi:hypothetical protein
MDWGYPSRGRRDQRRTAGQCALGVLLAAAALAPHPAAAQAKRANAITTAEILNPLVVINPDDMDFGRIMPGTANGTVVMNPGAAATCTTNAGIVRTGNCVAARFDGSLPFLFNLAITKPAGDQITLSGPSGATMRLHDFTFAKGSALMLGGTLTDPQYFVIGGTFIVYVGGTLDVARTQRPGIYNGTFTLTFNYN